MVTLFLYFGSFMLIMHKEEDNFENENLLNLTIEKWEESYEKLCGGFEDLGEEDSYSSEEEIDPDMLTKEGYSKEDGFVVDDDDDEEVELEEEQEFTGEETEEDEDEEEEEDDYDSESDESYIASELEEEEYLDTDDD